MEGLGWGKENVIALHNKISEQPDNQLGCAGWNLRTRGGGGERNPTSVRAL